jgi:hypothetical protein
VFAAGARFEEGWEKLEEMLGNSAPSILPTDVQEKHKKEHKCRII